jgi:YggT family protein
VNSSTIVTMAGALDVLRTALLALAVVVGLVAAVSYAVRTRRISPFHPVARFFRANVDPLMRPVEQRVVRSGGNPVHAPWWALGAVVIGGIVLISAIGFVVGQVQYALAATSAGPRGIVHLLITWAFAIVRIALLVRVVSSWFGISPYAGWVRWAFTVTEPILRPLRRIIPNLGMLDVTPIVAYFLLGLLQGLILGAL